MLTLPALSSTAFDEPEIGRILDRLADDELDELSFGVIAFDATGVVVRYNALESRLAGLRSASVIGKPVFEVVAPCMNNYMVAGRFEESAVAGVALDETIDYVLTLRMRPQKVRLRLVAATDGDTRYVLVFRRG